MRSEADFRESIEEHLERVERYLDVDVDALEPTQRANVARAVFNKGHAIATYAALLGDRKMATTWFERAARYRSLQAQTALAHPGAVGRTQLQLVGQFSTEALLSAVLSGSRSVQEEIAGDVLELDESTCELVAEREGDVATIDEAQLLAAVLLDHRAETRDYAEAIRAALPALDDHYSALPPGQSRPFAAACEAIMARDSTAVTQSVEQMLEAHRAWVDDDPRGRREVVDHPSTAILLLAADHDLEAVVESRFIPSCLFDEEVDG